MGPNMRTLETQVRLRRVIREQATLAARLVEAPADAGLAMAARSRLAGLLAGVRDSWRREAGPETPEVLRRHVVRTLSGLEALAAQLGLPGAAAARYRAQFEDLALPLLFVLRGLETDLPAVGRTA